MHKIKKIASDKSPKNSYQILAFSPLKVGFLFLNSKVKGSSKT